MIATLRDVHFAYPTGDFKLDLSALEVAARERVAVVGPSGCGKSTLLAIMAGLAKPHAGHVQVAGTDLRGASPGAVRALRAARLGMVHQDFQLFESLDVQGNILLPFLVSPALALDEAARDRAASLAQRAGLARLMKRSVTRLSQGERQRVAVCRALVAAPVLVLADEPTASLDQRTRDQTIGLLLDECERAGAALIAATHDLELLGHFGRTVTLGGAA